MLVGAFVLLTIAGLLYVAKRIYDTGGYLEGDCPRVHLLWAASLTTSLIGGLVSLTIASLA